LIRDTAGVLLDMHTDKALADEMQHLIESGGDKLADLHIWRLGPGHLGAIMSIVTTQPRDAEYYRGRLSRFGMLSHLTVEVRRRLGARSTNPWWPGLLLGTDPFFPSAP
jgi:Co/Zn/Cd efflux system component